MVQIHILLKDNETGEAVGKFLIQKRHAISIQIEEIKVLDDNMEYVNQTRLIFVTRHLLYNTIESELRQYFADAIYQIVALPVVEMNWSLSQKIEVVYQVEE